jgi:hypothetical protein
LKKVEQYSGHWTLARRPEEDKPEVTSIIDWQGGDVMSNMQLDNGKSKKLYQLSATLWRKSTETHGCIKFGTKHSQRFLFRDMAP